MEAKKPTLMIPDHDLLITLNTKVDQLSSDIRDLKDSLTVRVAKAEARLDAMDVYHAQIPLGQYSDDAKWVEGIRSNMKFLLPIVMALTSLLAGLIARMMQIWLKL